MLQNSCIKQGHHLISNPSSPSRCSPAQLVSPASSLLVPETTSVQVMRRQAEFGPRLFQGWMLTRSTQLARHLVDLQREALSFCRLVSRLEAALQPALPAAMPRTPACPALHLGRRHSKVGPVVHHGLPALPCSALLCSALHLGDMASLGQGQLCIMACLPGTWVGAGCLCKLDGISSWLLPAVWTQEHASLPVVVCESAASTALLQAVCRPNRSISVSLGTRSTMCPSVSKASTSHKLGLQMVPVPGSSGQLQCRQQPC